MKALFKPVSAALLACFLAACSLIPPAQQSSQRQIQAQVQTAADTGQKLPEKVTFPNMVKTTPLETNLPADKNDQLNAALEQALAEKPADEGFAVQSFNLPQIFVVRFMTQAKNLKQQVKIPENGEFKLLLEAGSGKKLEILDGDGSDGQATIRLPQHSYEALLHLQGPWQPNSSLEVSDDLYYVKDTLSSKQGKLLDLNRWFLLGVRPLPVPSDWYNPDGQKLVLKFKTDTVKEFQMAWWTTNQQAAYPPGIKQIGPEGGIVELPGVGILKVPSGGLDSPQTISMRQVTEPYYQPQGDVFVTPLVQLQPHGLSFKEPAQIHLNVFKEMVAGHHPYLYRYFTMTGLPFLDLNTGFIEFPGIEDLADIEFDEKTTHENRFVYIHHFSFVAASLPAALNLAAEAADTNSGLTNFCLTDTDWKNKRTQDFTATPFSASYEEVKAMCSNSKKNGHFMVSYPNSTQYAGSRFLGKVVIPKLLALEKGYSYFKSIQPDGKAPRAWWLQGREGSDLECQSNKCYIPAFVAISPDQKPDDGNYPYDVGYLELANRNGNAIPPYPRLWLPPSDTVRSLDITYHELYHGFQFNFINRTKYGQIFDSFSINYESFPYESSARYMGEKMLYQDWNAYSQTVTASGSSLNDYEVIWKDAYRIPWIKDLRINLDNMGRGPYDLPDKYALPGLMAILDNTQGAKFLSNYAMHYGKNFGQKDSVESLDLALGGSNKLAETWSGYGISAFSRTKYGMGVDLAHPANFQEIMGPPNNWFPITEKLDDDKPFLTFKNSIKKPYKFNNVSVPPLGIKYFLLPVSTGIPQDAHLTVRIDQITGSGINSFNKQASLAKFAKVLLLKRENGMDVVAATRSFTDSLNKKKFEAVLKNFRLNYAKIAIMLPNTTWGKDRYSIEFKTSVIVNPYANSSRYLSQSEDPTGRRIAFNCKGCGDMNETELIFQSEKEESFISGIKPESIETIGQDSEGIPIQEVKVVFPFDAKPGGISYIASDDLLSNTHADTAWPCWILAGSSYSTASIKKSPCN